MFTKLSRQSAFAFLALLVIAPGVQAQPTNIGNEWAHTRWLDANGMPGFIARRQNGSPAQQRAANLIWRSRAFAGLPPPNGPGGVGGAGVGGGSHIGVNTVDLISAYTAANHSPAVYDEPNLMPGMSDQILGLSNDGTTITQTGTVFDASMTWTFVEELGTPNPYDLRIHVSQLVTGNLDGAGPNDFQWGDFTLSASFDALLDLSLSSGSPHDPHDPWVGFGVSNVSLEINTANLGLLTMSNGGIAPDATPVPELDIERVVPSPGAAALLAMAMIPRRRRR